MREDEGKKTERAEEEPVEDHFSGVHLGEGDFAEEKSTAPEHAGESAGGEAKGTVTCGVLVQRYPSPRHFLRKIFQRKTLGVDLRVSGVFKTKARQRPGQASFLRFSISSASRGFPQPSHSRQL